MAAKLLKPQVGQRYRVIAKDNPHHGKVITVNEVQGTLAIDFDFEYPFLPAELEPVTSQRQTPQPKRPTAAQKNKLYKELLKQTLGCRLPRSLKTEIEKTLAL